MKWYNLFPFFSHGESEVTRAPDLSLPNYVDEGVLLAEQRERRKAAGRRGRKATDITGGTMTGKPTLGRAGSLFGL
jgi:hypothetical protein